MSDISGLSSRTPLAFFDPDSSSWKTSRPTFLSDSTPSSLTLPASGMTLDGVLYELPMLGPATDEPGSSSLPTLPTPVAHDDGKSPEAHMAMKGRMPGGARDQITSLSVMARQAGETGKWDSALLPTPRASPQENRTTRRTPSQEAGKHGLYLASEIGHLMSESARMLPPPSAADGLGGHERRGGARTDELLLAGLAKDVTKLLPTPTAQLAHDSQTHRSGGRTEELLLGGLAQSVSSGEPTDPPSSDTPAPSVEQLRIL